MNDVPPLSVPPSGIVASSATIVPMALASKRTSIRTSSRELCQARYLPEFPGRDAGELEPFSAVCVVDLHDPAADSGLTPHRDEPAGVVGVDRSADPPQVQLLGEGGECGEWVDCHLDLGRAGSAFSHFAAFRRSTCFLNAASCSSAPAWSPSSHVRTAPIASGRSQNTLARASSGGRSSPTIPALSRTRRCRLIVGADVPEAWASSPARAGPSLSNWMIR